MLNAEFLFQHRGHKAVFLACTRTTHFPAAACRFHSRDVIIQCLDVAVCVDPQHECIHRHTCQWCEFFDVHADVCAQRCCVV